MVEKTNWQEADQLKSGQPRNNSSLVAVRAGLELGTSDYKSRALTTRPAASYWHSSEPHAAITHASFDRENRF